METLKIDLFEDEVFVFTPKGEVKSLPAGATPLDFAYAVHTDVGHRCVGAKVNGKITPLHYRLQSGEIVEILTSKQERGPSRDWLALVTTSRARNKIRAWFTRERREDAEHRGRELLQETLRKQGLPASKITGSALLADVIREMGFRKADDFYVALGQAKVSSTVVANKLLQRLKQGEAVADEGPAEGLTRGKADKARPLGTAVGYGIKVEGIDDVMLRLAKCCRPVPGDEIVGYISLGRGITIHRESCKNAQALMKDPERFTSVSWDGENETSFRVELQVDAWDRTRLLEDLSRTFAEAGVNIVEARCTVSHPMVKNRFVVEVGDTVSLKNCVTRLRNIDSVFDAYRVAPAAEAVATAASAATARCGASGAIARLLPPASLARDRRRSRTAGPDRGNDRRPAPRMINADVIAVHLDGKPLVLGVSRGDACAVQAAEALDLIVVDCSPPRR